ncbi:MAG: hypothetical protein ACRDT0_24635 [Pseudonocardiaceae bacterium]
MIVDCDCCAVRGDACGDCVITVLLGAPPNGVELDATDRVALENLAAAGMVPRLQLVGCEQRHDLQGEAAVGDTGDRAQRSADRAERSARWVG